MISRFVILFFVLAGVAAAQTAKSRADLYAQIATQLASGQPMTAAQLRAVLVDVVASADNPTTDGVKVLTTDARLSDARPPTTHGHAIADVTGLQGALDGKSASSHSHSDATTSVAGFMTAADKTKLDGIEDGATADQTAAEIEAAYNSQVAAVSQADAEAGTSTTVVRWTPARIKQAILALTPPGGTTTWGGIIGDLADQEDLQEALDAKAGTGHSHGNATTSAAGFMTAADKTKLDGIATGATANATNAQLRDRATHTGEQAISTVTGLQDALDAKAASSSVAGTAKSSVPLVFPLTIDAVADGMNYAVGFVHAAFTIAEIRAVHVGTTSTPSILVTVKHHTDRSHAGNAVVTDGTTVTSTTTGNSVTSSFDDATVAANSWIWITTASKSGTTDRLEVIVRGTYD